VPDLQEGNTGEMNDISVAILFTVLLAVAAPITADPDYNQKTYKNPMLNSACGMPYRFNGNFFATSDSLSRGMQLSLLGNMAREEYCGTQAALGLNFANRDISGAQISLVLNFATGDLHGAQISNINIALKHIGTQAGILNISVDGDGVQAGVLNIVDGGISIQGGVMNIMNTYYGFIQAGVLNIAKDVEYVQSGVMNIAKDIGSVQAGIMNIARDINHAQGGVMNIARDIGYAQVGVMNVARNISYSQLGIMNIARNADSVYVRDDMRETNMYFVKDANHLQGGILNIAGRTTGRQIGIINIAGYSEKTPVGLLNIFGNGIIDMTFYGDLAEDMPSVSLRTGTPWFYTMIEYGQPVGDFNQRPKMLGLGLGTRFGMNGPFHANIDFIWSQFHNDNWRSDNGNHGQKLRVGGSYMPLPFLAATGGLSINGRIEGDDHCTWPTHENRFGSIHTHWTEKGHRLHFWPGLYAGVTVGKVRATKNNSSP
jgi:hypothetical protein